MLSLCSGHGLLHFLVEYSACRVNCGTYYWIVRPDSPNQIFGGQESLASLHHDWQYPLPDEKQHCQNVCPTCALLPVPPKLTGESSQADATQRQINADSLRAVFDLVLAPLHYVSHKGMVVDCAYGKTRLCFPILSAWIVVHDEHTTLDGIGSK